ncbi:uncharacterized protein LOC105168819 [Sesamum indicum]|uniref:Uncharacterized protein LOC105168819 n=1 Tax=Sesamum indicum TaxID=4182 RepID=A0A6I9TNV1_SESIN|nr:uncharacterized protein LOC105168819 [Sesamum indicum]
MDRLIKPDVQAVEVFFVKWQKCGRAFKLTNLMHTMSVAVCLTLSDPSLFSVLKPFSIIPPLTTSSFTLVLNELCDQPPFSSPPCTILVRSSMLPTGKAHQDDLHRLFSRPGPHIFKDVVIPIYFVGPHVAEFLLSPSSMSLEINFLFSKAISWCDESQLTSLLRLAVENGKSHFVSALIEAGADVNDRGPEGESLMLLAVKSGNADAV